MTRVFPTAALISAIMFASWALYVTLVEHPARLDSGAGPGRAQFQPSYRRAAPWQASFAVIGCAAGAATAIATSRWLWLAGAPLGDEDTRRLLQRWGRLHAVRTLLGGVAVMAFLLALER